MAELSLCWCSPRDFKSKQMISSLSWTLSLCARYGLMTSIVAAGINTLWNCLKYNLLGGDRVSQSSKLLSEIS